MLCRIATPTTLGLLLAAGCVDAIDQSTVALGKEDVPAAVPYADLDRLRPLVPDGAESFIVLRLASSEDPSRCRAFGVDVGADLVVWQIDATAEECADLELELQYEVSSGPGLPDLKMGGYTNIYNPPPKPFPPPSGDDLKALGGHVAAAGKLLP